MEVNRIKFCCAKALYISSYNIESSQTRAD